MKMETKKEVFTRYKDEYYKAKVTKGRGKTLTKIIDTVENVIDMGRKSIIRSFCSGLI